jgi:hypothetical protein
MVRVVVTRAGTVRVLDEDIATLDVKERVLIEKKKKRR